MCLLIFFFFFFKYSQFCVFLQQQSAKRNSSQGKTASKTAKPNTIHMSLSLREEVKLNQTDNAWVPTAAKKATKVDLTKNKNEEEIKTEVEIQIKY